MTLAQLVILAAATVGPKAKPENDGTVLDLMAFGRGSFG